MERVAAMTSEPGMGLHPGLTAAPDAKVPGMARDLCALVTRHRLRGGAVLRGTAAVGLRGHGFSPGTFRCCLPIVGVRRYAPFKSDSGHTDNTISIAISRACLPCFQLGLIS